MRIHLIGACGTAMGTLAALLKQQGHDVSGSDQHVYPPMSDFLRGEGITLLEGYRDEHVAGPLDLVIVGNAISRGNPELEAVLDRKRRYCSLPEAVRDFFLWGTRSIVVAGTHGKTTTTSLAGWLLTHGGVDPTVLVGGIARNFGMGGASYRIGKGTAFVIEGDEYDSAYFDKTAKFLKYLPDIAVIGNIEYDHADIYPDMESLRTAFRRFVNLIPQNGRLILGADCPEASRLIGLARSPVETFGFAPNANWRAGEMIAAGDFTQFELTHDGEPLGHFEVPLYGQHNVRNALAAVAVGHAVGLSPDTLRKGLRDFRGVRRRLEKRGEVRGVSVYDDFAHHPTAIFETIRAVKSTHPDRRVWAVFEPRSATSCRKVFQDDFLRAFQDSGADEIILASVFRASLPDDERLDVEAIVNSLHQRGRSARHLPDVATIVNVIAEGAREGDLVLIMSNGGFDGIHDKLLKALAD
jgi:UDP-N-acetylmuramate: L-alanyl-gamma-D-glutamyl-meso-diaminopimelate ligase